MGCDGLELDVSRFRYRNRGNISPRDASCKLCNTEEESPSHFLVSCPALSARRHALLQDAPTCVSVHLPHDPRALHEILYNLLQGLVWLKAAHAQEWLLLFIKDLRQTRADLLLTRTLVYSSTLLLCVIITQFQYSFSLLIGGYKEEEEEEEEKT